MTIRECIRIAAAAYNIPEAAILGRDKKQDVAHARLGAYWLARQQGHSLPKIARIMGRDHSTVKYGVVRAEALAEFNPDFRASFLRLGRPMAVASVAKYSKTDLTNTLACYWHVMSLLGRPT